MLVMFLGNRCHRRKIIRLLTKLSAPEYDLDKYTYFLISEPKDSRYCRLAEVLGISRPSANRFLLQEESNPRDLFTEVPENLNLAASVLNADESFCPDFIFMSRNIGILP
jgi:hypothetical protein